MHRKLRHPHSQPPAQLFYFKFALAELGRNKLHQSLGSKARNTASNFNSTGIPFYSSLPPATENSPRFDSLLPIHQHLKKLRSQGINSEATRDHGNQGRCLLFSLAALQGQLPVQSPLGPINIFLAHSHTVCLRKGLSNRDVSESHLVKWRSQAVHKWSLM